MQTIRQNVKSSKIFLGTPPFIFKTLPKDNHKYNIRVSKYVF